MKNITGWAGTLLLFLLVGSVEAQPKEEFRGVWLTTVWGLDWPNRNDSPATQQTALEDMLNRLKAAGINAVFFQVRSTADAFYDSDIEPWSYWLTGEEGKPPSPYWDPLKFAIDAARLRGMEVHAWLNPYRVHSGTSYTRHSSHITNTNQGMIITTNNIQYLDPGQQDSRDYVTRVVMDIARRYDVDGIHIDDYFYGYPPNEITNEDAYTFSTESRGFTDLGDWRRDNINLLIAQVADSLSAYDPEIKWGVSPFGIYRNGVPAGIVGLDAYNVIYTDPLAWLQGEDVDYLVPQLYWAFSGPQDYEKLANWWADKIGDRHLYPGLALYKADAATHPGTLYSADEIPDQILFNRADPSILGNSLFRARNVTELYSRGIFDRLATDLYKHPALTPSMPFKSQAPPPAPSDLAYQWTAGEEVILSWSSPATGAARFAVYRIRSSTPPDIDQVSLDATNLLAVTGDTSMVDSPGIANDPYYYFVRAVSSNSVEGSATTPVFLYGRATSVNLEKAGKRIVLLNYPNPFSESTQISFDLERDANVSLEIYNALGMRIHTVAGNRHLGPGNHRYQWDGRDGQSRSMASGTYFVMLEVEGVRTVKPVVLMR